MFPCFMISPVHAVFHMFSSIAHSPDNSFLGFAVTTYPSKATRRDNIGILYGKKPHYLAVCIAFLPIQRIIDCYLFEAKGLIWRLFCCVQPLVKIGIALNSNSCKKV